MSCHTLALYLADGTATARARLAGLAMHGHAERIAHLDVNRLARPLDGIRLREQGLDFGDDARANE